jgi:hypothetical protein
MKTFTATVLDACDRQGVVRIQRRDGRRYTLVVGRERKVPWIKLVAEHRARVARIFPEPMSQEAVRELDRLIAGEV